MRRVALAATFIALVSAAGLAQQPVGTGGAASNAPVIFTPSEANWAAAPDAFPAGAQFVVVDGDPTGNGPYVVRLKMPDGYKIQPHSHPKDEMVTVIDGTFMVGMGDQFSESSMKTLSAGSYGKMPQGMNHFAAAKGTTTVQVEGMGPFAMTYVNPSDDPRNKKK
jgi:quercetin dioxygenase-like cupin family protein